MSRFYRSPSRDYRAFVEAIQEYASDDQKPGEDVHLKQSVLDETYNRRTQVERTNDTVKDCGLGCGRARGRVHTRTQGFLALCLGLVVAITNHERGDNPGRIRSRLTWDQPKIATR